VAIAGATIAQPPAGVRQVDGPKPGVAGFSAEKDTVVTGTLDQELSQQGSVMFWFHTDQSHESGTAAPEFQVQRLFDIPGLFSVSLVVEQQSDDLYIGWGARREVSAQGGKSNRHAIAFSDPTIRVFFPSLPGPGWHHLAVAWNANTGAINAYLDGTPYNIPGSTVKPWKAHAEKGVEAHLSPVALADLRVSADPKIVESLRTIVGEEYWGKLDAVLGAATLNSFDAGSGEGKLLYSSTLAQPSDLTGWRMEGVGEVSYQDGWMEMKSKNPDDGLNGSFVYWLPGTYPDRFQLSFDFKILGEYGLNIIFFAARGPDGRNLFDPSVAPRNGRFIQYTNGDIDNYHISYFAYMPNEPRRTANLRKNSGFYLVANGPLPFGKGGDGKTHSAVLRKDGPHIQMSVDGVTIIDFTDDGKRAGRVWKGGQIAFRQMSWTDALYRNLRVSELR
jgi:hypothetical protein